MLRDRGAEDAERIRFAYEYVVARPPSTTETQLLEALAREQAKKFRDAPEQATALLRIGESAGHETIPPTQLAGWTIVASSILNLDETISKE